MSKTSEENLTWAAGQMYWKRFVASGTGFVNKYRYDVFFRTTCNIVALHIVSTLIILATVGIGFDYLYRDIFTVVVTGIREGLQAQPTAEAANLLIENVSYVRTRGFLITASIIASVTLLLGYIVARVTLRPARHSLEAQKQFIGNIAHELRTPLTILKTNTEIELLDSERDPSRRAALQSNIEELNRMAELINNLLSINAFLRPESVKFADVDLGAVVDGVVDKLSDFAEHKRLQIIKKVSDVRFVHGNATALEQIVMNIIKNAIWYTPDGGTISISIEPDYRNFIELTVQDSGIGISRDDLFRIFEPFYRAERSRSRHVGGSGLGLTIVNELVKLHRGKIAIRSFPRRGTTVIVSLPSSNVRQKQGEHKDTQEQGEVAIDFSRHSK